MGVFDGRRVVITGAGGGIGSTMVGVFAEAGAEVIACDLDADSLDRVDGARRVAFDLTDAAATRTAVERICADYGAPDVLISNAGFTRGETLDMVDDTVWARELDVNLTAAKNIAQPVLEQMIERRSGAVVFISSVNALAHFGNPAYAAAKAGLLAYARAIAVEHGRNGVRANAICPGSVRTAAWEHRVARDPDVIERVSRFYPIGRLVEPVDVARAAVFLASPAAAGITGVALPVDGGLTAGNLPFFNEIIVGAHA